MKRVCIVIIMVYMQTSIAQIPINAYMESLSKTFDIKTFNKKKDWYDYNFITKDSTIIEQHESDHEYREIIKPKNSYIQVYSYYYLDGTLKRRGGFPNDFETGIWRTYDKDGNLIKEEDTDAPYKITFQDILAFMKKRGIKMGGSEFRILRSVRSQGEHKGRPSWGITYEKEDKTGLRYINIHGTTGEIITDKDKAYDIFCSMKLAKT